MTVAMVVFGFVIYAIYVIYIFLKGDWNDQRFIVLRKLSYLRSKTEMYYKRRRFRNWLVLFQMLDSLDFGRFGIRTDTKRFREMVLMEECKLLVKKEQDNRDGSWSNHYYCCAYMPRDLEFCLKNTCMLKEKKEWVNVRFAINPGNFQTILFTKMGCVLFVIIS